ncbi:MAG: shikimate dehydrogenase [Bacteroidota bacterium]|nr:shikimate dehydrogenase [Bacteroidota bacterium]MDP4273426.1 shikimate dehydrogenase [Bacteroidota bacterium]
MNIYGLIGYPLSHSFSPEYFANKFRKEKIADSEYKLFPLEDISQLPILLETYTEIRGLNVTIPYKEKVMAFMDSMDDVVRKVGAMNTIKISRTGGKIRLSGHNSDVYGFYHSLLPLLEPSHKKALILGTGGASKAVSFVLDSLGIRYRFVSRSPKSSSDLSYVQLERQLIEEYTLIINSTPVGMFPHFNECPAIPYQWIGPNHLLYDLIYNPDETLFLQHGKERGAIVKNGLEMLHLQAERSWEIWNRKE